MPPLLQNPHILTNKSNKDIFMNKGQSLLKPQEDIWMLSIVSKFLTFHLKLLEL